MQSLSFSRYGLAYLRARSLNPVSHIAVKTCLRVCSTTTTSRVLKIDEDSKTREIGDSIMNEIHTSGAAPILEAAFPREINTTIKGIATARRILLSDGQLDMSCQVTSSSEEPEADGEEHGISPYQFHLTTFEKTEFPSEITFTELATADPGTDLAMSIVQALQDGNQVPKIKSIGVNGINRAIREIDIAGKFLKAESEMELQIFPEWAKVVGSGGNELNVVQIIVRLKEDEAKAADAAQ